MGQQAGARPSSDHVDPDVSPGQGRLTRRRLGRWWGSTPPSDTLASLKTSPLYVLIAAVLAVVAPGLVLGIRRPAVIRIRIRIRNPTPSSTRRPLHRMAADRLKYRNQVRDHFDDTLGHTPVDRVDADAVQAWVGRMRSKQVGRSNARPGAPRCIPSAPETLPTPTRPYEAKLRDRIQPTAQSIRSGDGDLEPA
jgi:hypothetical protein